MLTILHGAKIYYALKCGFGANNNEAEYESLITNLGLPKDISVKRLKVYSNSMFVV